MTRLSTRHPVELLAQLQTPRRVIVLEESDGCGGFRAVEGPFLSYERRLELEGDQVLEHTTYELAVPFLGFLFALPVRHELRKLPALGEEPKQPIWAPPQRIDARASTILALLALASLTVGYLNTLLTQTVTFAADEFGSTKGQQTVSLAVVRTGIVIALVVVSFADRRGRRPLILICAVAAPLFSALGAFAPNLSWLTATQAVGRPLALSLDMVILVVAAEEMPKEARAYAVGILALSTGLGAGFCVMALPIADAGVRGWRLVYLLPLLFLFLVRPLAKRLPESRRYNARHATDVRLRDHMGRFVLLASAGLLINLLVAPASGLQNDYLKDVRGYSATAIALFTLGTQTPAGIGVLLGGEMADRYGRRLTGAVALFIGALATVATFFVAGWQLWLFSLIGATTGGAAVPAIGVYQTELFPTGIRGRAKAGIVSITLVGSTIGLLAAGAARDRGVSYGEIMAVLVIGPLLVCLMMITLFPETAHYELEELNPEDSPPE